MIARLVHKFEPGQSFGRLTVVRRDRRRRTGSYWLCACSCGNQASVLAQNLARGGIRSCGCLRRELAAAKMMVHGHKTRERTSPEYRAWRNMIARCCKHDSKDYANYGGRGICVWAGWISDFCTFLNDVGERPSAKHSLDRFPNNDGDYGPGNVRWATRTEQNRNQRRNIRVRIDGVIVALADYIDARGLSPAAVRARLYDNGWPIERALELKPHQSAEFLDSRHAPRKRRTPA